MRQALDCYIYIVHNNYVEHSQTSQIGYSYCALHIYLHRMFTHLHEWYEDYT